MKKLISYGICLAMLAGAGLLTAAAPDSLSRIIVGMMTVILLLGEVFGVIPVIRYSAGFKRAMKNIKKMQGRQPSMLWVAIFQTKPFFWYKRLDRLFDEYKRKAEQERKSGMIVGGIDEFINEEEVALKCWRGIVTQIPGMLTGLGLLSTLLCLMTGIQTAPIRFPDAVRTGVQSLFSDGQAAIYPLVSGVILSILFHIVYKILWNLMTRNMGLFTTMFQRQVIPSVKEQQRYSQMKSMQQVQTFLDRLPQGGGFSLANGGLSIPENVRNESVLMPQILSGLQNGEFLFYLQPRYDLNTQRIVGAEALVRWKHAKLGMVAPSVFIPLLESNGYITKLDQSIWEKICLQMRQWIDEGIRPVPISINISKTDILALDITEVFSDLIKKYRIPPSCIEFDIAQNAYLDARGNTQEFEREIQAKGFRVVVDGFRGDFFSLALDETAPAANAYKLDLRFCKDTKNITEIAEQARNLRISMVAEGIENMEQISTLRKSGVTVGQGFYLSKSVSVEEFEKLMMWKSES